MTVENPLVSIVMATHNRAAVLGRSLDSLLEQTYTNTEIILVNDASEDNTAEVLAGLAAEHDRLRVINLTQNEGHSSRNRGISAARGKYVAIMDDDDICLPDRIEKQVAVMEAHPEADVCFGAIALMDENGHIFHLHPSNLLEGRFPTEPADVFRMLLLDGNMVANVTLMVRREVLLRYPYWSGPATDWALVLLMAADGVRMIGLPEVLVNVDRAHGHRRIWEDGQTHYRIQHDVLRRVCEEKHVPPALARRAASNLNIRMARNTSSRAAVGLTLRALIQWPGNPSAHKMVRRLARRVLDRGRGLLPGSARKQGES